MSLAQFLGDVGNALSGPINNVRMPGGVDPMTTMQMPGPIGGFGGGTFDMEGQQVTPIDNAPPQPTAMPPRKKRGGVGDFLGKLGDALLVGAGGEPIYAKKLQQEHMGDLLAEYLGMSDPGLANIMREDPETGLEIWKASRPKPQDQTALQQNIEYLRRLNPGMTDEQLAEVAQYAIAAPRMYGSVEAGFTPDPNYPFARQGPASEAGATDVPTVSDATSYAKVPPGGTYLDPEGKRRVKPGGGASNGAGNFPSR